MTYVTLKYEGQEKALSDWGSPSPGGVSWRRSYKNQIYDNFAVDFAAPTDGVDLFPYGASVQLQIGRIPDDGGPVTNPNGSPRSGVTKWKGGMILCSGYRSEFRRGGSPDLEMFRYKFSGIFEKFFNTTFRKFYLTWNGSAQVANYIGQFDLGVSLNATLVNENDVITGTTATNYMSIAQQVKEILSYTAMTSANAQAKGLLPGSTAGAQFDFDGNTATVDGANYDLGAAPSANVLIPDFLPGYGAAPSGQTSASANIAHILRAPVDAVNNITSGEAMREQLKWIGGMGGASIWVDYSTTPPTVRCGTRDQLPAKAISLIDNPTATVRNPQSLDIRRCDELIPDALHFEYKVNGSNFGQPNNQIIHDIVTKDVDGSVVEGIGVLGALKNLAGVTWDGTHQTLFQQAALLPEVPIISLDYIGQSITGFVGKINTAAVAFGTVGWWENVIPKLASVASLAFFTGAAAQYTITDPGTTGAAAGHTGPLSDLAAMGFYLLPGSGGVSPWMQVGDSPAGASALYCSVRVKLQFTYLEQITPGSGGTAVPTGEKTDEFEVDLVLTNLASGVYHAVTSLTPGEVVPLGMAGFIFDQLQIPQFEGTVTFDEENVSNLVPPGYNLNLTGSAVTEWAGMNAQVQSIEMAGDAHSATTTVGFGPAKHLGFADMAELLRVNHGPRWTFFFGSDQMNAATGGGSTSNLPIANPASGSAGGSLAVPSMQIISTNIADLNANPTAYTTPPGFCYYGKGKKPAWASDLGDGPGWSLGDGVGGAFNTSKIICDWSKFLALEPGTFTIGTGYTAGVWQADWHELAVSFDNGSGVECNWFITYFGTPPYKKS